MGKTRYTVGQLGHKLTNSLRANPEQRIVIRPDKDVNIQRFLDVILMIKTKGVVMIGIEHDVKAH